MLIRCGSCLDSFHQKILALLVSSVVHGPFSLPIFFERKVVDELHYPRTDVRRLPVGKLFKKGV